MAFCQELPGNDLLTLFPRRCLVKRKTSSRACSDIHYLKNKCLQRRGPRKSLGRQGLHSVKDQNVFVSQVHVDPPSSEAGHPSGPSQVGHPRDLVPVFSGLGSKPGPHKIHPGLGKMGLHKR